MNSVNKQLFEQLLVMLPGLPENITKLDIQLEIDKPPKVHCSFYVKSVGELKEKSRTFLIRD